jgi:putative DNA primase/helicase
LSTFIFVVCKRTWTYDTVYTVPNLKIFVMQPAHGDQHKEYRHEPAKNINLLQYNHTDTGNAERLIAAFGHDVRYCPELRKWLIWSGSRWKINAGSVVRKLAIRTLRLFYFQAAQIPDEDRRGKTEAFACLSENDPKIHAMLNCLKEDERIEIDARRLDADPWVLNCLNGTLNLQADRITFRDPCREDLITKTCPVNFGYDAECPRFLKFLHRIFDGDTALIEYIQRALGYWLTGAVHEKAVFCLFGSGSNGKTTLLETIRYVMGDYAGQVMIETLLRHDGTHDNAAMSDLADLKGIRFVTTSEPAGGSRLAEATIKQLTGMGQMKTRRIYENPIMFPPTHKIVMDMNDKPHVNVEDDAVWDRLKAIPCTVKIPAGERDGELCAKLKAEAPGILLWAAIGCWRWQRFGLEDSPKIQEAGALWQRENDAVGRFTNECCRFGLGTYASSSDLAATFAEWNSSEGYQLPIGKLRKRLHSLGCAPVSRRIDGNLQRGWSGVTVSATT